MSRPGEISSSSKFFVAYDLGLVLRISILLAATLIIFSQDIYIIGSDALASSYFNYVLIIPFFIFFLIFQKRKILAAVLPLRDNDSLGKGYLNQTLGLSCLAVALIIYLYGSYTSYPLDYHLASMEIFLGALVLLLFNRSVLKMVAVPILFITAALPSAIEFSLTFWLSLSYLSTIAATRILDFLGFNAVLTSTATVPTIQLTTGSGNVFSFVVGVASSGDYSFIGFTIFAAFVAYIAKGPIWKRVLLFIIGYLLLPAINIVRLVIMIAAADFWGIVAFNAFHFSSGIVLVFLVTLALLIVGEKAFGLSYFQIRRIRPDCPYCAESRRSNKYFCFNCGRFLRRAPVRISKRDVVVLVALILIVIIFASSIAPSVALANAPSSVNLNAINAQNAMTFLPHIPGWNLTYLGEDAYIMEVLGQDAALQYLYYGANATSTGAIPQIITTIQISPEIHTPETSLIQYPLIYGTSPATSIADYDVQILPNPPVVGRFFAFQETGSTQTDVYFYWNLRSLFDLGTYSAYRNVQITLQAYMSQLVSYGYAKNDNDLTDAQNFFVRMSTYIANYWAPQSGASIIQLGVKDWATPIAGIALVPAAVVSGEAVLKNKREGDRRKRVAQSSLSEKDRKLLDAISKASEGFDGIGSDAKNDQTNSLKASTTGQVARCYSKLVQNEISPQDLLQSLTYAERAGLVRQVITDNNGEPIQVWKGLV